MPTYEYLCPAGHEFELFQKMSDKPRAKCPTCGKLAVRKISGGAGLVFKGSGFYITDYGKDGKGPRKDPSKTESAPTPAPATTTPAASDAKPASAPAKAEPAAPPPTASKSARKKGSR
ncbi:MAG: zinc ribbon domain-containing protein [Gemmatimonadota bacterium]